MFSFDDRFCHFDRPKGVEKSPVFVYYFLYFCVMKIFRKNSVTLLLFLLIFSNLNQISAKSNDTILVKNFQVELRTSYAYMMCHHQEMNYFKAHFPIFELSVQQVTFGRKSWQSRANYPTVGITFLYSGLGGFKEVGEVYALYPFMSFNCLESQKNQISLKLGIGLGYLTTHFDIKTNPKNTFIGSYANAAINLTAEYNRFITNRLSLAAFIGFTHFSNGARKAPNKGINLPQIGINAKYFISEPHKQIPAQPKDNQQYRPWISKNYSFYCAFTYAIKEIDDYIGYGKRFNVYNLQLSFLKRFTEISKLGIGFDIVYDMTDIEILKFDGIPFTPFEILKPGINLAYEMAFGSSSFIINIGCHLAGKEMGEGYLYQKLCAKQNISKHFFAMCALVTHFGRADNFCFGLGYKIN